MSGARGGGRVAPPPGGRAAAAAAAAGGGGGGGEEAAPVSALEVVSFLGKLLCAVAALKAALYLLRRVCLAMAWKSGGASHSELIHNLRSESAGRAGGLGGGAAKNGYARPHAPGVPAARARLPTVKERRRGEEARAAPGRGVCGAASPRFPPAVPARGRRPLERGGPGSSVREEMRRGGAAVALAAVPGGAPRSRGCRQPPSGPFSRTLVRSWAASRGGVSQDAATSLPGPRGGSRGSGRVRWAKGA